MSKLRQGECYSAQYEIRKGETTPPKRYTSGSIILAMEGAEHLLRMTNYESKLKPMALVLLLQERRLSKNCYD